MRRKVIILAGVVIAAAGSGWAYLSATAVKAPPPASPPPVPVVAQKVKSGDVPIYLRGIGTVFAYNTVVVRSQITGQLVKIAFKEGQHVEKGELLAEIDPASIRGPYRTVPSQQKAQ